jgi:sulfur-carrier protein adenylyltransferase/sulfurtransferase
MNIKYSLLVALVLILSVILLILPEKKSTNEISPKALLYELKEQTHYKSTDEIAERLINQDPSIMLIDVRMSDSYFEYSLPGAENVPLEDILHPDWEEYLDQANKEVVFFSNSDVYAEQAWLLARRMGYENLYVMKGGLNHWFETIIQPVAPSEAASTTEFDLFEFRKGASIYFCGGQSVVSDESTQDVVVVSRKKKKTVIEGGC